MPVVKIGARKNVNLRPTRRATVAYSLSSVLVIV